MKKKRAKKKRLGKKRGFRRVEIIPRKNIDDILKQIVTPISTRFTLRNVVQVIVGATILAVPVGFTEETWVLGESLPMMNIFSLLILSVLFTAIFAYRRYKKNMTKVLWGDFTLRVVSTYSIAFIVVAVLLTLIQKAPWGIDPLLAFKRSVLVAFPASMSATIADTLE
jgi:uncharacterized membrane protein